MSIDLDSAGKEQLRNLLGIRLRAARKGAKMTEMDAATVVGQKEQTQISLWESGARMPPLQSIIKLADAYAVPVDYLLGRIDDPIADPTETNYGVIVNVMNNSMQNSFKTLCEAIAQDAAVTMEGYNADRRELKSMCSLANDANVALARFIELNPEFEEDMRGSATLKKVIDALVETGSGFCKRIEQEQLKREVITREISYAEMQAGVRQFELTFSK